MPSKTRQSTAVGLRATALTFLLFAVPVASSAQPPCVDDASRTLFAGFGDGSCQMLRGDQAACESAYYIGRNHTATSCVYVGGACFGCGGGNGACPENSCNGEQHPMAMQRGCPADPSRTTFLGYGDNDSRRCRNLDQTDQATCEDAYYNDASDLDPTACWWDVGTGWCLGCGENSKCPFNECEPAARMADAPCTGDPSRTTLLGLGDDGRGNSAHPGACRQLDNTDQATCEDAWYEDNDDFVAIACWWNGLECRGSGAAAYADFNVCLGTTPKTADATCPEDPSRTLIGLGQSRGSNSERGFETCRQFDGTDQATCESSFYASEANGLGVACWWNAGSCRGSGRRYEEFNACQLADPKSADAECTGDPGRSTLLGFGRRDFETCRQLDNTDQATCEDAYYEAFRTGAAIGCSWHDGECRGCGRQENCLVNECFSAGCEGESRSTYAGFGGNDDSNGVSGGACNQFDDQLVCEDAYYENRRSGKGTACWWDGARCRGSGRANAANDACRVPAECTREPGRSIVSDLASQGSSPCPDFGDETTCEQMYYEHYVWRTPSACWWDGFRCRGSSNVHFDQNACLREPAVASATCAGDSSRTMSLGFGGARRSGDDGPCRVFDGMQAQCEISFYEHSHFRSGIACWWDTDGDLCRGSSRHFAGNDACFVPSSECTEDPGRTSIGRGQNETGGSRARDNVDGGACRQFDDTDQATCEGFYYEGGGGLPIACWWDGDDCRGSSRNHFLQNACILPDLPQRAATAVCDATPARTMLLGFGNNGTAACAQLDDVGQTACEMAYYEDDDDGFAVACWWDGTVCRGSSSGEDTDENVCAAEPVPCEQDPDRSTFLGWGNTGRQSGSGPCRQFDGMREQCEDAFYRDKDRDESEAVACFYDDGDCRGTNGEHSEFNACYRGPLDEFCKGAPDRTMLLGRGDDGSAPCRNLDDDQAACETAFYLNRTRGNLLEAVACIFVDGPDACLGTSRFDALNECDLNSPAVPSCPGRSVFVGRGGRVNLDLGDELGGACKLMDTEETCNQAYYVNAEGEPIACHWNGECSGTNIANRLMNACRQPAEACDGRDLRLGFGGNNDSPCRALDDSSEGECHNAYYETDGGRLVSCEWNPETSVCMGCGSNAGDGSNSICEENTCLPPLACDGDQGRTLVDRCVEVGNQSECESSWHVTGTENGRGGPPIAAACVWVGSDLGGAPCLGCGLPNQAEHACSNACADGCGDGDLDPGEECDDGNLLDGDCCDSQCQLEADGAPCTDRLFCTEGIATCDSGTCVGETARVCSTCLTGACNEEFDRCTSPDQDDSRAPAVGAATLSGAAQDMSMPLPEGSMCDDGIAGNVGAMCNEFGMCEEGTQPTPTATATATPTATVDEPTPVPDGAPCSESSQCGEDSACIEGFCAPAVAPAPAASPIGLLIMLLTVVAIGASTLRWRRDNL